MVSKMKQIRFLKGLSQWQVALAAGMSQGRLSLLERGFIRATDQDRRRIAEILETGIDELFAEDK